MNRPNGPTRQRTGFTLVELLVVTAVLGLLAALLLPALRQAKNLGQSASCLGNFRQLTLGWLMYADDHQGWLCPNGTGSTQGWVGGVLNFEGSPDNTNLVYLTDPRYAKLASYISSPGVYHCPADRSPARVGSSTSPRVRSVAMNLAFGSNASRYLISSLSEGNWPLYHKQGDLSAANPSGLWVLITQHPDSIDDGRFVLDCGRRGSSAEWIEFPAYYHNGADTLSFADGHAERHFWRTPETTPPVRFCGCLAHYATEGFFTPCPNSADMAWLQAHTSQLPN